MQIRNTQDSSAQYIKCLIYGMAGAGKTRLCDTTGGTPLIISVEGGLLSLSDSSLDVVDVKSMEDIIDVYNFLIKDNKYDWVCLDSISEISEVVLESEKKKTNNLMKAYGETQVKMLGIMRDFRDLPKNIYFSAKMEKVKDEMTGGLVYSPSTVGQKLSQQMPYIFDLVFPLHSWKAEDGTIQRTLQTQKCNQYDAKDRSGKLDMYEKPDLGYIHNKILNKGV